MTVIDKILVITLFLSFNLAAKEQQGNTTFHSFNKAKKAIYQIYRNNPRTFYCNAEFKNRKIISSQGFTTSVYKKRAKRTEIEHVLPAENFGRSFTEWRVGHRKCIDNNGKAFKGRRCAEYTNHQYRLLQSDLYNLVPAIGAVNAARQNFNFTMIAKSNNSKYRTFGSCSMLIDSRSRKAQPPKHSRGSIARTYLYMDSAYSMYSMSRQQKKLMLAWDRMYPVSRWECYRAEIIKSLQGNVNLIMQSRCN